jgi:hypothetical protein
MKALFAEQRKVLAVSPREELSAHGRLNGSTEDAPATIDRSIDRVRMTASNRVIDLQAPCDLPLRGHDSPFPPIAASGGSI